MNNKKLIEDHWKWVEGLLMTIPIEAITIEATQYLYKTAMEHGIKHREEDQEVMEEPIEDVLGVPPLRTRVKECPFCGGAPTTATTNVLTCYRCGIRIQGLDSWNSTISVWNNMASFKEDHSRGYL